MPGWFSPAQGCHGDRLTHGGDRGPKGRHKSMTFTQVRTAESKETSLKIQWVVFLLKSNKNTDSSLTFVNYGMKCLLNPAECFLSDLYVLLVTS